MERGGVLGAGGVRRAGRQVHRQPRLEQHVVDPPVGVDLPLLGAVGLEDEDVVAVGVDGEALRAGRRQVGVGLARVAELELELGDQVAQRRPVAVQPLQHHGGAGVELGEQPSGVDQAGQRLAGERGAGARVARLGQHRAVARQPDGRRTDRGLGQQVVDVVERQQPDQPRRVGLVEVDAGRPDLREEGLGVTAEQVERVQDGLAVRAVGVTVGAVRVTVGAVGVAVGAVRVTVAASVLSPSVPSASPSVPSVRPRHRRCRPRRQPTASDEALRRRRRWSSSSSERSSSWGSSVLVDNWSSVGRGRQVRPRRREPSATDRRAAPTRYAAGDGRPAQSSRPRRRAIAAASVRPAAPSLPGCWRRGPRPSWCR